MSSGSSLGSLTSTGSRGSQSSVAASISDIYINPCQRLTYDIPEIDRDALFQRIEHLLKSSDNLPSSSSCTQYNDCHLQSSLTDIGTTQTAVSQNSINSSSDASSSVGCLPTYEEHLEIQKCRHHTPVPTTLADPVNLTDSLQALGLGPFTSRLIASETFSASSDLQSDCHLQSSLTDIGTTQTTGYVCLGQSDASSGVSGEGTGGSDCALTGEVNRITSRHVSSGSATESDSGICDASMHQ